MSVCDLSGDALPEMAAMVEQGVTSFKLFMAYPGRLMLEDPEIARVMRRAADLGALVCPHAEDEHAIEALVEAARERGDVIWHPRKRWTITAASHHMRVDYNLYEGREVTGGVEAVSSRGRLIVDGGEFIGRPGAGQFVNRTVC